MFHKLVFRAFPNHFGFNSIYAHFPFTVPPENKLILDNLGKSDKYSWDRPKRRPEPKLVKSYKAVTEILGNKEDFKVVWGDTIQYLASPPGHTFGDKFCLSGDTEVHTKNREDIKPALYISPWAEEIGKFYADTTAKLLAKYSYGLENISGPKRREVDLTRDVINMVNVRFSAALFCLPIKTDESPRGIYTEQDLYLVLTMLFTAIFFDADPANSFKVNNLARDLTQQLGTLVALNAEAVSKVGVVADIVHKIGNGSSSKAPSLAHYGTHMIQRLLEKGKSVEEVVWGTILPMSAASVANQGGTLTQCIDYYLQEGKEHLPKLHELAHANTKEADDLLMK